MSNSAKIKAELKAVFSELFPKNHKNTFVLKRMVSDLDKLDCTLSKSKKELEDQNRHVKFLLSKISNLEKRIDQLKSQLKKRS